MPEQDPRRGWHVTPWQIMAERLTSSGWVLPGPVGNLDGVLKRRLSGDADGLGRGADDWLEGGGPGCLGGGPATMDHPTFTVLDARAERSGRTQWSYQNGGKTHDISILQANGVGYGVTPGGYRDGRISLGGAGASARRADRAGAARDAHRDQG